MKLPYIDLYIGDWLKDSVSGCSLAAQGLWLRLLFIMQESPRRGYLLKQNAKQNRSTCLDFASPMNDEYLARRCSCTVSEYQALMAELWEAGVPSKDENEIVFSRRMVKDEALREVRAVAGSKGGKARLLKQNSSKLTSKAGSKTQANADDDDGTDNNISTLNQGSVRGDQPPAPSLVTQAAEIYELYPRKVGRPDAIKAIARQVDKFGFDLVKTATERFAKAWVGGDMAFCPHPATWFNQERFNDLPETWNPHATNQRPETDRNAGTANAGRANDYANRPKV